MPTISFDEKEFAEKFEKQPFLLKHDLCDDPRFQFDYLIETANRLPAEDIEFNAGDVEVVTPQGKKPDHQFSAEETIERIRNLNTWLGLKKVRQIPEFAQLIDDVLDTLKPHIDRHCPGMHDRQGFIFITSPNSTVPYHMDPEHNFLFQISGEKYFTIFDKADREILPEEEIEKHYGQSNRKMVLRSDCADRGTTIRLKPGDAMHVPINAPHYVTNSDDVSVSISITYNTPSALKRELIYRVNRNIRKFGFDPRPFEHSATVDGAKLAIYRLYHLFRYQRPSPI